MRLNTQCSIALHCLIFISIYANKTKVTSELLAESTGCNSAVIRKILNQMKKAGIIYVKRGVGGAYLQKKPENISLWEIYCTVEPGGLNSLIGIHSNSSQECPVGCCICNILSESYQQISQKLEEEMKKINLQTFLDCYNEQ